MLHDGCATVGRARMSKISQVEIGFRAGLFGLSDPFFLTRPEKMEKRIKEEMERLSLIHYPV